MPKLNYFSSNKSIVALVATSIISLSIYLSNDSSFIRSISGFWNDSKAIIMQPKNNLETFDKLKFENTIVENLRLELLLNNQPSPYSNAIQSLVDNKLNFIRIKKDDKELDSNEWVFAQIFLYPKQNIENTVLIDVGKDDFKEHKDKRFVVLDTDGNLIGRIIDLGNRSSKVQLVNNSNNMVMVSDKKQKIQSVLMVPISHNKCKLNGVSSQDNISIGDTLYTASNSAVYISEIPVCRVLEVNEAKNKDPFKNVTVELLTDLRTINFGVVISSDIKFE